MISYEDFITAGNMQKAKEKECSGLRAGNILFKTAISSASGSKCSTKEMVVDIKEIAKQLADAIVESPEYQR